MGRCFNQNRRNHCRFPGQYGRSGARGNLQRPSYFRSIPAQAPAFCFTGGLGHDPVHQPVFHHVSDAFLHGPAHGFFHEPGRRHHDDSICVSVFLRPGVRYVVGPDGSRILCTVGMALLAIALFLLSRLSAEATSMDMAWRLALAGIGIAVFISPNSAAAMSAVPPRHRGIASGSVATARNLGMVVGVASAGLIFNSTFRQLNGGQDLTVYAPSMQAIFMTAFQDAMLAGSVVAAFGVVVAYLRGRDSGRAGAKGA